MKVVYGNLLLITPEYSRYYSQVVRPKLIELRRQPTRDNVVAFVQEQIAGGKREVQMLMVMSHTDSKFWRQSIPTMLNSMIQQPLGQIPLLSPQDQSSSLSLTHFQLYLLLCHLFFCTLPPQTQQSSHSPLHLLYSECPNKDLHEERLTKLTFLTCYFAAASSRLAELKSERVEFRRTLMDVNNQGCLKVNRALGEVARRGGDEDGQHHGNQLQIIEVPAEFGGTVFEGGRVGREEVLFLSFTELLVLRVICPSFTEGECLLVSGIDKYSFWQATPAKKYRWKQANRINRKQYRSKLLFLKLQTHPTLSYTLQYKQHFTKSKLIQLHTALKLAESIKYTNVIYNLFNSKFDQEYQFLLVWIAASRLQRRLVVYTDMQTIDEMIEVLREGGFNTQDLAYRLRKFNRFRQEEGVNIGVADYLLEFSI